MKLQKLNKALKKLVAKTVTPKPGQTKRAKAQPAQAAKKASSSKTKKGPVVTKKAAPKKPAAPAKKAAAPVKPNHAAAKAAPAKALTPKAQPKAEAKPAAKDAKKKVIAAAPSKAPAPVKQASAKAPAAGEDKSKKKAAAPVEETHEEVEAVEEAPKKGAAPAKAAKARKEDEAPVAATATEEEEEVVLTDAEGRRYCRVKDCDQAAAVDSYCRYHYLLFWKNIQNRKKILSEGKLERYIEELTARYPDKYLELLRKDLRSEKDFTAAIQELEIDDTGVDSEYEDEAQSFIDEVRGMGSSENNEREEDF